MNEWLCSNAVLFMETEIRISCNFHMSQNINHLKQFFKSLQNIKYMYF